MYKEMLCIEDHALDLQDGLMVNCERAESEDRELQEIKDQRTEAIAMAKKKFNDAKPDLKAAISATKAAFADTRQALKEAK